MSEKPDALVTMRLKDMTVRHPDQDNSRVCSECGEAVGIYPTGQRALALNPALAILCSRCGLSDRIPSGDDAPAGTWEEVFREISQSKPVQ